MNFKSLPAILCLAALGLIWSPDFAEAQSAKVCDAYARDHAKQASRQGQVLGLGAAGSIMGAGVGSAFGGRSSAGALIGGGAGIIGGGAARQKTAKKIYKAAYQHCMTGRI
jgi:hypothetical protein